MLLVDGVVIMEQVDEEVGGILVQGCMLVCTVIIPVKEAQTKVEKVHLISLVLEHIEEEKTVFLENQGTSIVTITGLIF